MNRKIPAYLIAGNAISAIAFYMCIPFLAIHLSSNRESSPLLTGVILGSGPLISAIAGLMAGSISDYFGRRSVLIGCIFLRVLVSLGFAFAGHPLEFLFLNLLNGITMAGFGPVSKALISDLLEPKERTKAFGYLYVGTNVGGALGPLLGAMLFNVNHQLAFLVMATVSLVYSICLHSILDREASGDKEVRLFLKLGASVDALIKDSSLFNLLLSFSLVSMAYAQLDSTLPQTLQVTFAGDKSFAMSLYSYLFAFNAVLVVLFQKLTEKIANKIPVVTLAILGIILISIGLLCFGIAGSSVYFLFTAMLVFTLGEMFEFFSSTLLVDRLAPPHLKGTYFGAFTLRNTGRFFGPILGIYLLRSFGSGLTFSILTATTMVAIAGLIPQFLQHRRLATVKID